MALGSKVIRLFSQHTLFPLTYRAIDWRFKRKQTIEDVDGIVAEIVMALKRNLNFTFEEVFKEEEMWDLKSYPNVISYNRMKQYDATAELFYSKVLMFSKVGHTQRGSFLTNISTIPLWFMGLLILTIMVLSSLTKWFERSRKFGTFSWMYLAPMFQQSWPKKLRHRVSAHLLNIWFATMIILNSVVTSYITAEVLIGQKVVLNHLKDILNVKNLKFATHSGSDAMQDFFGDIPGELGKRIRKRQHTGKERNSVLLPRVAKGELVYIEWHEELKDLDHYCRRRMRKKTWDGTPIFYQSPFILKIDPIVLLMKKNHTIDKETMEAMNRILRRAASACLCDSAVYRAFWKIHTRCVTTENLFDPKDHDRNENEARLLMTIYVTTLIPSIAVLIFDLVIKMCCAKSHLKSRNSVQPQVKGFWSL